MKKKGYMLVETLIVSVTVTSILIYLYAQFTNVQLFYNEVYKYNNVNELYLTGTIKNIIVSNNKDILNNLDVKNICDINNCENLKGVNSQALAKIIDYYKVKNIILAKEKTENSSEKIKEFIKNDNYSKVMKDFSNALADNKEYSYRIIVEYNYGNDDTQVATVLFSE